MATLSCRPIITRRIDRAHRASTDRHAEARLERRPESYAIVALRDARGADGALTNVWFTYRGRDVDAQLDRPHHQWRVRANGRDVGRVEVVETDDANAVAQVLIGVFFAG